MYLIPWSLPHFMVRTQKTLVKFSLVIGVKVQRVVIYIYYTYIYRNRKRYTRSVTHCTKCLLLCKLRVLFGHSIHETSKGNKIYSFDVRSEVVTGSLKLHVFSVHTKNNFKSKIKSSDRHPGFQDVRGSTITTTTRSLVLISSFSDISHYFNILYCFVFS